MSHSIALAQIIDGTETLTATSQAVLPPGQTFSTPQTRPEPPRCGRDPRKQTSEFPDLAEQEWRAAGGVDGT